VTSDTSFVNGADQRLSKPFMVGFTESIVLVYWVGFAVILLAFILTWFFTVPPLRKTSALQEQADAAGMSETGSIQVQAV
jgi:flagellar biosynthesis/type III secretory pathway M-ring protein FliF/YscJ